MKVDLIVWGDSGETKSPYWTLGEVHGCPYSVGAASDLINTLAGTDAGAVLSIDPAFGLPEPDRVSEFARASDLSHLGLALGTAGLPREIDFVAADWSIIDPDPATRSNSWRVSMQCCLFRTDAVRVLGGLDSGFKRMEAAALELGWRWLRNGATVWYEPSLLERAPNLERPSLPAADLYLFLRRAYGDLWGRYVLALRSLNPFSALGELRAWQEARAKGTSRVRGHKELLPPQAEEETKLRSARVSAIIPTLGRYPYITDAIKSLESQTVRPFQVICVDQNPVEHRQPEVYTGHDGLDIQVIWQDERGQSLARNTALDRTTGDYVFLFDDDSVAHTDAIEQHLRLLWRYGADLSTGVSFRPDDGTVPNAFAFPRIAQTLDTGNSVITRAALEAIGGLDRAYDHGMNTDLDLGTRLYLSGRFVLHNPLACRIHYKAPTGGLRTYGAWWATSTRGLFEPFPGATQVYYMKRYLSSRQRRARLLLYVILALSRRQTGSSYVPESKVQRVIGAIKFAFCLPVRLTRSHFLGQRLFEAGPRIPSSSKDSPSK